MEPFVLPPTKPKSGVLVVLPDALNLQVRELAGRRGQPLGHVVRDILAMVVPGALAAERARGDA